ncbi:MAG TPA: amidohydrolase family protein [Gammaproteobacteria bacterium]|nr:amidohydrolase family protein [Gammaproteobacteria bacterium]
MDLQGDRLLPGLINAHDHLQLNSLPAVDQGRPYTHARDWIADVTRRRQTDPSFEAQVSVSREERLLIGGVKNLLSGATTVAHHDPLYRSLTSDGFPTRVVTQCGWAHSLYLDGEEKVLDSYRITPREWPWIIHSAEGVDAEAASEFDRLEALGCLGSNTLIVHGIALDHARRTRLDAAGAGLLWCPSSNLRLFGRTAAITDLVRRGRVALGTDSRLSGARDLLSELRAAHEAAGLDAEALEALVTADAAALLCLPDRGVLRAGALADLVVLPAGMPLFDAARADVRLVAVGGNPLYADADYAEIVRPAAEWAAVSVDGRSKKLESSLAAALSAAALSESGLELS